MINGEFVQERCFALMNKQKMERYVPIVMKTFQDAAVGSSAAELAYYSLLSLLPILLLLASIIPLLPFDHQVLLNILTEFVPDQVEPLLLPIFSSYLETVSTGAISISFVLAIWSASAGFSALQRTMNRVYQKPSVGNPIVVRLFSFLVTVLLVAAVGAIGVVYIFGETIFTWLDNYLRLSGTLVNLIGNILSLQLPMMFVTLLFMFTFIYWFIPNVYRKFRYSFAGAAVAAVLSLLLSMLFGVFVRFLGGSNVSNTTLGIFISLMLYLFLNGIVIIVGAIVNVIYYRVDHYQDFFRKNRTTHRFTDSKHFNPVYAEHRLKGSVGAAVDHQMYGRDNR